MVRLVQLMCPQRHATLAIAYEGDEDPDRSVHIQLIFAELVAAGKIKPVCEICGSETLAPEDRETRFETLVEAAPILMEESRRQRITNEFIRQSRN